VTSLLSRIVDWFVCWVRTGATMVLNAVITAIGDWCTGLLLLLPDMPDLPDVPAYVTQGFAWGAYWFPLTYLLTLLALYVSLWVAWTVIAIPLRWAKATNQ